MQVPYSWSGEHDIDAACWVAGMLGSNAKTISKIRAWNKLPFAKHHEWGCGNHHPERRFNHMMAAVEEKKICTLHDAEKEAADIFSTLVENGKKACLRSDW